MLEKITTALFPSASAPAPTAADRAAAIERLPEDQRAAALEAEERIKAQRHDEVVERWREWMRPASAAWASGEYLHAVQILRDGMRGMRADLLSEVGEVVDLGRSHVLGFVLCALFVDRIRRARPDLAERIGRSILEPGAASTRGWFVDLSRELTLAFGYSAEQGGSTDDRRLVIALLAAELALYPANAVGVATTAKAVERAQRILDAVASSPTARGVARLRVLTAAFDAEDERAQRAEIERNPPAASRRPGPKKLSLSVKF